MRRIDATDRAALRLVTTLLQRARLADPEAGLWEAADVQWWSRRPRLSDQVAQSFWLDDEGPVAAVLLTSWTDQRWQVDPIAVPGLHSLDRSELWAAAMEQVTTIDGSASVEVPVRDDDRAYLDLAAASGLVPGEASSISWLDLADRPPVVTPADGYAVVSRAERAGSPHPMAVRNGPAVADRLAACSLYDAELDLAIESADGEAVGYALFWFDPITSVGLIEPVRVEDDHQRRGLATAMLTAGIDRLAARGARRAKIGFGTEPASAAYQALGFRPTSTMTSFERDQ